MQGMLDLLQYPHIKAMTTWQLHAVRHLGRTVDNPTVKVPQYTAKNPATTKLLYRRQPHMESSRQDESTYLIFVYKTHMLNCARMLWALSLAAVLLYLDPLGLGLGLR